MATHPQSGPIFKAGRSEREILRNPLITKVLSGIGFVSFFSAAGVTPTFAPPSE